MASEIQGAKMWAETLPAGADLSGSQFYFVKRSSNTYVLCAAVTDVPAGVLQNKPESGEAAEVLMFGPSKVVGTGDLTVEDYICTDAAGRAIKATIVADPAAIEYVVGKIVHTHTASVTSYPVHSAVINCINPPWNTNA